MPQRLRPPGGAAGRTEGLALLRQAVEEAPADVEALRKLVKGLRLADRPDEARAAVRAGLFRNPRCPRSRRLWQDYQIQLLRRRQQSGRRRSEPARPASRCCCRSAGRKGRRQRRCRKPCGWTAQPWSGRRTLFGPRGGPNSGMSNEIFLREGGETPLLPRFLP